MRSGIDTSDRSGAPYSIDGFGSFFAMPRDAREAMLGTATRPSASFEAPPKKERGDAYRNSGRRASPQRYEPKVKCPGCRCEVYETSMQIVNFYRGGLRVTGTHDVCPRCRTQRQLELARVTGVKIPEEPECLE